MDINDFNSPLRGLLNSPARKFTPAVPIPDWDNLDSVIRSTAVAPAASTHTNQQTASDDTKNGIKRPYPFDAESQRPSVAAHPSVIQSTADYLSGSVSASSATPQMRFVHRDATVQSPDPRKGAQDVPVTPSSAVAYDRLSGTVNPHSMMPIATPVVSGPTQAKHSIKIQNCVSTVNSDCELNLLQIYQKTRFSEYNPSRFHGLIMRIREPRTTALIFSSGKMVCTGARNERDSCLAVTKFIRIVEKVGFPVRMLDFKIQNFVATADLRFPIRLELLHHSHGQFSSYEPEMFPGLVYRMVRPRMVMLIFVNGKLVFTGAKSRNEIEECLDIIYPILRSFKKN